MIISRYLLKEVINALLAVTFVLVLIFLCQQTVRYLNYIASGKVAANMLLQLIGFEIPYLLALLLPLGLYLAIILTYGRLYNNQELTVLHACGYEKKRLFHLTTALALAISGIVLALMLWVNPWLAQTREQAMRRNLASDYIIQTLMPGRFQATNDGKRVIYVERFSRNHKAAENIFIAEEKTNSDDESSWVVVSAKEGYQGKELGDHFLIAKEGFRYEGVPGQKNYRIIQFNKYAVRLPNENMPAHEYGEMIPSNKLFANYDEPHAAAELQWRLSVPLSVILLSWFAVALSQINPRQGRTLFILLAILIYVVYVNLLFVSRHWVQQETMPIAMGMWSIHIGFFIIVLLFLATPYLKRYYLFWRK